MKSIQISKKDLNNLYLIEKKTQKEIAEIYKCNLVTVLRKLQKYGIKSRKKTPPDLIGKRFGKLVVVERKPNQNGRSMWLCKCDCGKSKTRSSQCLLDGTTTQCLKCANHEFVDLTGQKFGHLIVVEKVKEKVGFKWKCICKCGKELYLTTGIVKKQKGCISCGKFKGHEEISGLYFRRFIKSAKDRNLSFDITIEFVWDLFIKQNRKCAYTGQILQFVDSYGSDWKRQTASLDRIDSSKGYVRDNIQWVHKNVNRMKNNFPHDDFIKICNMVTEYTKEN